MRIRKYEHIIVSGSTTQMEMPLPTYGNSPLHNPLPVLSDPEATFSSKFQHQALHQGKQSFLLGCTSPIEQLPYPADSFKVGLKTFFIQNGI